MEADGITTRAYLAEAVLIIIRSEANPRRTATGRRYL